MTKTKLFSDVTRVRKVEKTELFNAGLINSDRTVIGWARLAPWLSGRNLPEYSAKLLVLLELESDEPRRDLIQRLVSYISYATKEETMKRVDKLLED